MKFRYVLIFALATAGALSYFAAIGLPQAPGPQSRGPQAVPFEPHHGASSGWKIMIPGGRPLTSPAVVDGRIYIGGGFGSHEFYAFDAGTGKPLWTYHTADDGPTAAVVSDGKIIFNTESCELEVITREGRPLWKKWLGDPLMSMPAVADGTVYMAYPNSRSDHRYYLAAFDLENGREKWKHPISGEIITAPIVEGRNVYVAAVDGALFSFASQDGTPIWNDAKNATSAPAVWQGQCFFSRRERTVTSENGKMVARQHEMVAARAALPAAPVIDMARTRQQADYLDYEKRKLSRAEAANQSLDASVGFAGASKGSAPMALTSANLGQASVHGVWAYQGSKPFIDRGRLYSSMADKIVSVDPKTERVFWSRTLVESRNGSLLDSALTPPAIVNGKLFVGSRSGEVFALSEDTGEILWKVNVGEPVIFQPVVASGRIYVPTERGNLFSFETGDRRDDGWLMWGATSAHNGLARR